MTVRYTSSSKVTLGKVIQVQSAAHVTRLSAWHRTRVGAALSLGSFKPANDGTIPCDFADCLPISPRLKSAGDTFLPAAFYH